MEAVMPGWRDFSELKVMLRAMAHDDRLNILHLLAGQNQVNVTDLVSALAISQPLVSWHLRMLRRAGLVRTRRQGRVVFCSLDADRCAACLRELDELVARPGGGDPTRSATLATTPGVLAPAAPAPGTAGTGASAHAPQAGGASGTRARAGPTEA
jgi:DNA-binding transcriptional ArsR family regulator